MDREKVINGLCDAIGIIHAHVPKRYWGSGEQACRDAIALLKEQEEEIESLKQTAQSMMEGVCLLKEQEAVVHCGDCENFCFDNISPNAGRCMLTSASHSRTWFCAHGKREER